jgi:hypothetical protein
LVVPGVALSSGLVNGVVAASPWPLVKLMALRPLPPATVLLPNSLLKNLGC